MPVAMRPVIRLLFLPRETFPTFRGRIDVLFGRELLKRGHEIDLIMQASGGEVKVGPTEWVGRTVWVGPTDGRNSVVGRIWRHWLGFRHDFISLLRRARHDEYDAVLVSDKIVTAALSILICKLRGIKFLFWLTFPEPEAQLLAANQRSARYPIISAVVGRVLSCLLYHWVIPRSFHVLVQSPQMARNLRQKCRRTPDMTPVLTGFDPLDFPTEAEFGPPAPNRSQFTIAYLGTLNAERRLDVLIEMLALLRESGCPARLLLIGDGDRPSDRRRLEDLAAASGVAGCVVITGFLPRHEALSQLRLADVGISLFYPDAVLEVASPTKLVEYMAMGLPAIVNTHPEQRAIMRESRGGICTPWGARHFARAVRFLISQGPTARADIGARGRRWVLDNRQYSHIASGIEAKLIDLLLK